MSSKRAPLPWFEPCRHCPSEQAPEARKARTGGGTVWVCPACQAPREPLAQPRRRVAATR